MAVVNITVVVCSDVACMNAVKNPSHCLGFCFQGTCSQEETQDEIPRAFLDVMSMLQTQNSGDAFVNKLRATKTSYVVTISNELTLYPSVLNSSADSRLPAPSICWRAAGSKLCFLVCRFFLLSFEPIFATCNVDKCFLIPGA